MLDLPMRRRRSVSNDSNDLLYYFPYLIILYFSIDYKIKTLLLLSLNDLEKLPLPRLTENLERFSKEGAQVGDYAVVMILFRIFNVYCQSRCSGQFS